MPEHEIKTLKEDISALKIALNSGFSALDERTGAIQQRITDIANRPQGVPFWVVLAFAIPNGMLALGVLVLVLLQVVK